VLTLQVLEPSQPVFADEEWFALLGFGAKEIGMPATDESSFLFDCP
jgi:hypothetical protein